MKCYQHTGISLPSSSMMVIVKEWSPLISIGMCLCCGSTFIVIKNVSFCSGIMSSIIFTLKEANNSPLGMVTVEVSGDDTPV